MFRTEVMMRLAQEHWSGAKDHNYRLLMVLNLALFLRLFIDGVGVDKLEEWIASSMSADSVSEVGEPARSRQERPTLRDTRQSSPADDRTA